MSQRDPDFGGLGLGTTATSYVFLGLIFLMVAYLYFTGADRTEKVTAQEGGERREAHAAAHHPRRRPSRDLAGQEG
jgi:hypothetical protein